MEHLFTQVKMTFDYQHVKLNLKAALTKTLAANVSVSKSANLWLVL